MFQLQIEVISAGKSSIERKCQVNSQNSNIGKAEISRYAVLYSSIMYDISVSVQMTYFILMMKQVAIIYRA